MRATIAIIGVLCLLMSRVVVFTAQPKSELAVGDRAPNLVLEDASGTRHQLGELRGAYVLLLFGHRELREENKRWAEAFQARYGGRPHVRIFMIADMQGVPFLIPKSLIRNRIRAEKPPVPLLLDWDQKVNTLFGVDRKRIDIFVVDPTGTIALRQQASGFTHADFAALVGRLDAIISGQYLPEFATAAAP